MDEIKELIELVAEKDFAEFELVRGRFKLRLEAWKPGPEPVLVVSQHTTGASPAAEGATAETVQAYPANHCSFRLVLNCNGSQSDGAGPGSLRRIFTSSPRLSSAHSIALPRRLLNRSSMFGDTHRTWQDTLHHRGDEAHERDSVRSDGSDRARVR